MANRVIMGAFAGTYGLRVSRPGFNVLNMSLAPQNVAFDSRWPDATKILMQGTSTASGPTSIMFPKTFNRAPPVLVYWAGGSGRYDLAVAGWTSTSVSTLVIVQVLNDRIFWEPWQGTKTVRYVVFDNEL